MTIFSQTADGGAVNIATSQSTSSASYTTLTTPDQVTNIVVPANGLIAVWYQAVWQESVVGAGKAAIFIGSNQLKSASAATPSVQEAVTGDATPNNNSPLSSFAGGLQGSGPGTYTGDVTTGQAVGINGIGGACHIFVTAGTYTISIKFKASSGSVTASSRKLWVKVA